MQNRSKIILYILLFVVLLGAGVGLWLVSKNKKSNQENLDIGMGGRTDASGNLTEDELINIELGGNLTDTIVPNNNSNNESSSAAIYIHSVQAKQLIDNMVKALQSHAPTMNKIVAKHNVGQALVASQTFTGPAQAAIDKMFAKLPNIDQGNPNTYPVYGTQEPGGATLRAQLQNLLDKGWQGLNLTNLRDSSQPWWIPELSLNLLTGTTTAATPSADNIWWGWAQTDEMEHYKHLNGHWVNNYKDLTKIINDSGQSVNKNAPGAKAAYPAGTLFTLVEKWVAEIDRLDQVTRQEAILQLQENGFNFTYVDPQSGVDTSVQTA